MNAVEYIHSLRTFGKKAGLENIRLLLEQLGNPHRGIRYIHIAGTNGKGSVSAMINNILIESDKKVGLFTSPFIELFNERICVNNMPILDKDLERITTIVRTAVEELEKNGVFCTVFDVICAVGFVYFKESQCDFVVLEVGLGGRFDSTNIIEDPLCTAICAIGFDHMQYLGNTIGEIAYEKCGIIKKSCPCVLYPVQERETSEVVIRTCNERHAPLTVPDVDVLKITECNLKGAKFEYKGQKYEIRIAGEYQIYNSLCAIEIAKICGVDVETIQRGLKKALWKCRFEVFNVEDKTVILDGAHNSHGINAFCDSLNKFLPKAKKHYVFGMVNDKDIVESCKILSKADGEITVTSVPSDRSTDPLLVFRTISDFRKNSSVHYIHNNEEALMHVLKGDSEVVCILGSLYMTGYLRKYVEKLSNNNKTS